MNPAADVLSALTASVCSPRRRLRPHLCPPVGSMLRIKVHSPRASMEQGGRRRCARSALCHTGQSSVAQARSHGLLPSGECGDYLRGTSHFPSFLENVSAQVRLPLVKWITALILLPPRDGVHQPLPPGPAHQACCTLHRPGLYPLYVRLCVSCGLAPFADLMDLAQVRRHRAIPTEADGRLETGSTFCYVHFSSPSPSPVEERRFRLICKQKPTSSLPITDSMPRP